jgi:hypothetical protein
MLSSRLSLEFKAVTGTQVASILSHYKGQLGAYYEFDLSSEVLEGLTYASSYTLTGYRWRYVESPAVTEYGCGVFDVELELESAIPQGASISGLNERIIVSFTPGAAGAAGGLSQTVSVQFVAGPPISQGDGIVATITASFTAGAASVVPAGITETITVAFSAGAAAVDTSSIFKATTYTGTGSSQSITGLGFEPGFVWTKRRTAAAANHHVYDNVRGINKYWSPNLTAAEVTLSNTLTSFDSDGFTVGSAANSNTNGAAYVAWSLIDVGATASNSDGTITTTVASSSGNGLSIFTYTGNGTSGATIGHGLGEQPDLILIKGRSGNFGAVASSPLLAADSYLTFTSTNGQTTSTAYVDAIGTTTITIGNNAAVNQSTATYVAYAFKSKSGKSKVGSYAGGGSTASTITLDFEPSFVLIKPYSTSGSWMIFDAARGVDKQLDLTNAIESTVDKVSFASTGFTAKANQDTNTSGVDYLYVAFK